MIDKKMMTACAFTGHRPNHFSFKYNEQHPDCIELGQTIKKEIVKLIEKDVTQFYSGMAMGVDIWASEAVLALKKQYPQLELFSVLPCETQANHWNNIWRERYFNILEQCDDVHYISRHYTSDCMFRRNRFMVDRAEYLLAVYDGGGKGGTAYTVRYAQSLQRSVIIIPASGCQKAIDFGEMREME